MFTILQHECNLRWVIYMKSNKKYVREFMTTCNTNQEWVLQWAGMNYARCPCTRGEGSKTLWNLWKFQTLTLKKFLLKYMHFPSGCICFHDRTHGLAMGPKLWALNSHSHSKFFNSWGWADSAVETLFHKQIPLDGLFPPQFLNGMVIVSWDT